MTSIEKILAFREQLRHFEREIENQNSSNCCCGVTLAQCHTLMELDKIDNISLKTLSENLNQDKSSVSRIVEGLVNLGLVNREIPKNNRRTVLIKLTQQGISVCEKINDGNNQYFREVLNSLSPEQFEIFLNSFKSVVSKMRELSNNKSCC